MPDVHQDPLEAALCRVEGQPSWWDDEIHAEDEATRTRRHGKAQEVCARCPVIAACAERFDPDRDAGVWFGVVHERGHRTHRTTQHVQRQRRHRRSA